MSNVPTQDMGAEAYQRLLEQAQRRAAEEAKNGAPSGGLETLTPEEGERFKKAFDDPEFRKLFAGYMDEMQDPKNRHETEEYISQLEGEKKVPAGKELIRPNSGFVVKTHKLLPDAQKTGNSGSKPSNLGDKVFVNIVQSDKITAPTKTPSADGKVVHWSLPYSVGPPHMEVDKSGTVNVPCFDCCFHPEAVTTAMMSKQFKDLVVQTAMDGIEASYKRSAPPGSADAKTKLDRAGVHILKGVAYKSGDLIPTMLIDSTAKKEQWAGAGVGAGGKEAVAAKVAAAGGSAAAQAAAAKLVSAVPLPATTPAATGTTVNTAPKAPKAPAIKKGFLDRSIKKEAAIPTIRKPAAPASASSGGGSSSGILLSNEAAAAAAGEDSGPLPSLTDVSGGAGAGKRGALVQEVDSKSLPAKATTNAAAASAPTPAGFEMKATSTSKRRQPPASGDAASSLPPPPTEAELASDSKVPRYTFSERGSMEHTTQQFESIAAQYVASSRPSQLVYRIELPKVTKASAVALDVQQQRLLLTYQDVYALDVNPLPYPIFEDRGNAKYDKVAKVLTVTLPVRPVEVTKVLPVGEGGSGSGSGVSEVEEVKSSGKIGGSGIDKNLPPKSKATADQHAKWLKSKDADSAGADKDASKEKGGDSGSAGGGGSSLADEIRRKAQEAVEAYKKQPPPPPAPVASAPPAARTTVSTDHSANTAAANTNAAAAGGKDFYPSKTFAGRKEGYVFKLDEAKGGLGYHRDLPPHVLAAQEKAQKQAQEQEKAKQAQEAPVAVTATATATSSGATALQPFPFEYRQHLHCLSVIVGIPNIVSSSVALDFNTENTAITVTFSAASSDKAVERYGLVLQMPVATKGGNEGQFALNPAECTYDVAMKNMVLVLTKKEQGMWTEGDAGAVEGKKGALELNSTDGVLTSFRVVAPASNAAPASGSTTASSNSSNASPIKPAAVVKPPVAAATPPAATASASTPLTETADELMNQLTFSSATGSGGANLLFELD